MSNPFADVVSVEVVGRYQPGDIVELTIRIPEQFFTETYNRADWESSLYATTTNVPGFGVEYLIDHWKSNLDIDKELYGPDGQQVPLW